MPALLDELLVAAAVLGAVIYLTVRLRRRKPARNDSCSGSCCPGK